MIDYNEEQLKELSDKMKKIKIEREDPGAIDLREYLFIPKLKIKPKKRSDIYEKMFPGVG